MKQAILLLTLLTCISLSTSAQNEQQQNNHSNKIAVFAPLYLDSLFTESNYLAGNKFPRFALQGLDFIQGAQIALDSTLATIGKMDVTFFDSKSTTNNVQSLINSNKLDEIQLIIGSVRDEEFLQLASFAQQRKIPFVSVTYPNDGGVTANPYLIIENATLKAHCEAIYSLLIQNHGADNIIYARKTGNQEDRVAGYFTNLNKPDGKQLLKIKTINIDSNFNVIKNSLDSNKKNIIIGASLDEEFASNLVTSLSGFKKKYNVTLIGMPNWNAFNSFSINKKELIKDFPIYYTSPYFNNKSDKYSKVLQDAYLIKYKGYPSDIAYKGFESILLFSPILINYGSDFMNHLNDSNNNIFCEYNFMPVYNYKNTSTTPDYIENKHLYFLKRLNGITTIAW